MLYWENRCVALFPWVCNKGVSALLTCLSLGTSYSAPQSPRINITVFCEGSVLALYSWPAPLMGLMPSTKGIKSSLPSKMKCEKEHQNYFSSVFIAKLFSAHACWGLFIKGGGGLNLDNVHETPQPYAYLIPFFLSSRDILKVLVSSSSSTFCNQKSLFHLDLCSEGMLRVDFSAVALLKFHLFKVHPSQFSLFPLAWIWMIKSNK